MIDPHGFQSLLARAQAGDSQAVDELLKTIRPWLEKLCHHQAGVVHPEASTSDLAQEAWLRAWRKLDQFQGGDGDEETLARFRAWLSRIVQRLALNARRDQQAGKRKPPGPLVHWESPGAADSSSAPAVAPAAREPRPSANVAAEEQQQRIRQALAKVADETDREIVRLRIQEGLSLRQIAERLQTNHEQVRQRFNRVLRQLEHDLQGLS